MTVRTGQVRAESHAVEPCRPTAPRGRGTSPSESIWTHWRSPERPRADIGGRPPLGGRVQGSRPMRAATIREGAIVVEEHPDPEPESGELLVRVRAAGLNGA